jgi:hypothetical protein
MKNEDIERIEAENARQAIEKALEILGEHFGAVQILASHETVTGETVAAFWGVGNWYARTGMAHEFIERDSAQNFAWEIKNNDDDDD